MKKILFSMALLFSMLAFSNGLSQVELRLVDFFGDYRADDYINTQMDISTMSLKEITLELNKIKRTIGKKIDPHAVVIGYGEKSFVNNFIVNTTLLGSEKTMRELMGSDMPEERDGARWYFYFLPKEYSQYLYETEPHHWASPY
jgi:hypothetical protein